MPRRPDRITVELDGGLFDRFSSLTITNDIVGETSATFEVGDDGAWPELERLVAPGAKCRVLLNNHPRLVGRAEINEVPGDAAGGVKLQLTVRTKLADARYASADESIRVENVSVKDFILALYSRIQVKPADFVFGSFAARDLMTGVEKGSSKPPINLEPMRVDQAKVQPPETIWDAAGRHLKRYHALHWDMPDGRILVGIPDDTQQPRYHLQCRRGAASKGNNVLSFRRVRDWSDIAMTVEVHGQDRGIDDTRQRVSALATDEDVLAVATKTGHFYRNVSIPNQEARTPDQAAIYAERELSARRRRKDAYEVLVDGWTYWGKNEQTPWAIDTTASVDVDVLGVEARGSYLVTRTDVMLSTTGAATTKMALIGKGLWVV